MRAMDEDLKFPLAEKLIYLDNAAQGALPESTIKVMEEYIGDRCAWIRGDVDWREGNDKWAKKAEGSKELFAKIIGAKDIKYAYLKIPGVHNIGVTMVPHGRDPTTAPWTWTARWDIPLDYPLGLVPFQLVMKLKGWPGNKVATFTQMPLALEQMTIIDQR